jgi:hypothetical protein
VNNSFFFLKDLALQVYHPRRFLFVGWFWTMILISIFIFNYQWCFLLNMCFIILIIFYNSHSLFQLTNINSGSIYILFKSVTKIIQILIKIIIFRFT